MNTHTLTSLVCKWEQHEEIQMALLLSWSGWSCWPGCEGSWCPGENIAGVEWGCSSGAAAAERDQESSGWAPADQPPFTSASQSTLAILAWQSKGKRQECWESTEGCSIKKILEDEPPKEVVGGRGTSHATEMKVHEAVWLRQLLRSFFWCVLTNTPIRGLWGHTGSLCMLERSTPRAGVSCGRLYRE